MKPLTKAACIACAIGATCLHAQESHRFASEANKLKAFQEVVRTHDLREPFKQPAFCTHLLKDLRAGRNIVPIEPDVRADSEDDPKLAAWRQCDGVAPERMQTDKPAIGYSGLDLLGGPPYRYYKLELDGDKDNGPEDLLYHEVRPIGGGVGHTGYTWVDLPGCVVRGGVSAVSMWHNRNAPAKFFRITMIADFRGVPVALDLAPSSSDPNTTNYRFRATRVDRQPPVPMVICNWREHVGIKSEQKGE